MTALIMYVDDIVVTENDDEIKHLKGSLTKGFEIKDLGFLRYFLGIIEVVTSGKGIFLSQRKYVLNFLKESGMEGYKPCATLIEVNHRMKENDSDRLIDAGRFQRLFERLIYMSLTRPDITYAINVIS